MKKIQFLSAAFAIVAFTACSSETTENIEDKVDTLTNKIETKVDDVLDKDPDAEFINDAIKKNTEELHLLALARAKAKNSEVKSMAKMMEADHKKLGGDVMAYASKKNIAITADTSSMDNNNLDNKEAGADWDRDWVDKMVNEHEKTVKKFEDEQDDVKDPELKQMIADALPTLRSHEDMAKKLQDKLKK